jgi:hypothetical protein
MATDFSLKDIPFIGDYLHEGRQAIHGNPDAIKAAYDAQIQASKDAQEKMQAFLMGQKGGAQAFYNPIQHMFEQSYGTEGLRPQANTAGAGPISRMYGGK